MTVYNANDKGVTYSYVSGDNGESWQIRGTAKSDSPYRKYVEACYAQLSDKSLLQICPSGQRGRRFGSFPFIRFRKNLVGVRM